MAITLQNVVRSAMADAAVDLIDGASPTPGYIEIRASTTVLATVTLVDPAFDAAANGVATARGDDDTNPIGAGNPLPFTGSANGNADNYIVYDGADVPLWAGVVSATGGGGDMQLSNVSIATAQDGEITGWTFTMPAS